MIRPTGLTSRGLLWGFLLGLGAALFLVLGAGSASADEQSPTASAPPATPNPDNLPAQDLLGSTVDQVLGSVAQPVKKILEPVEEIGSAANDSAHETAQGMSPKTGQDPTEKRDAKSQPGSAEPNIKSAPTTEDHTHLAAPSVADGTQQGNAQQDNTQQRNTQRADDAVSGNDRRTTPTRTTANAPTKTTAKTSVQNSAAVNTTRASDAIGSLLDGVVNSLVTPLVADSVSLVVDTVLQPLTDRVVGPLVDNVVAPAVGHTVAPIVDTTHEILGATPHAHSVANTATQTHPIKHAAKRGEPAPRQTVHPQPGRAPAVDTDTAPLSFHAFKLPPGWVSSPMPSPAPLAPYTPKGMSGSASTVLFQPLPGTTTMLSDLRDDVLLARMGWHDTFQNSQDAALPETSPG